MCQLLLPGYKSFLFFILKLEPEMHNFHSYCWMVSLINNRCQVISYNDSKAKLKLSARTVFIKS